MAVDYPKNINIGSIFLSTLTDDELIQAIDSALSNKNRLTIAHANAQFVVEANVNKLFENTIDKYSLVQPDGIGVYLASKVLFFRKNIFSKVQTGTDFYYKLLDFAQKKSLRIFFLGSTEIVQKSLRATLEKKYTCIVIAGTHHGFFDIQDKAILKMINDSKPDLLIVGMGVPKQEFWLQQNIQHLQVLVTLTVGAGIEFLSEQKKRAPVVLRYIGLEWFFRLIQEPKRLWKRYIIGIPHFAYLVIKQKITGRV